ncbi:MAG: UDP-N-acetylglucosamine 2-epimerase (non-hydrolyzing) [Rhodothermales bacterium]
MRVLAVVGARPQFVKAAEFARACSDAGVDHVLVHTGQHYDDELSRIFFEDLGIPDPDVNLGVGSANHANQTAEMMRGLDAFLNGVDELPDWVVVFGDTNSTLAAALVAVKRGLPVAHVEAGLRSYDSGMPEEINRLLTDRMASALFCPTEQSVQNLAKEGCVDGVHLTGDVMYDSLQRHKEAALGRYAHPMDGKPFNLATVHRAENTDDRNRLEKILACLAASPLPVLWPLHPRTKDRLAQFDLSTPGNVVVVPPVGYLEMLACLQYCERVISDSGGLQKEAYWLGRPCITLRSTTEWPETLEGGWNVLVDVDLDRFAKYIAASPRDSGTMSSNKTPAAAEMVHCLVSRPDNRNDD